MHMKQRYKYYPQMEHYDSLVAIPSPYLMFKSQSNYCSDIVNTDSNGFRFSGADGKLKADSLDQTGSVNIFTGGSTAFGVGATSDKSTIPAYLSKATNSRWVNFSGRAYTSTQEFISFAYYRDLHPAIDNIVIFSGINDIFLYFASKYFNGQMGTFFNASDWMEKMNSDFRFRSLIARPFINKMLGLIYGPLDFQLISDRDAVNLFFRKISMSQVETKLSSYDSISQHSENPSEVIDVLRSNMSNWKIMADSYNAKITYFLQPFSNWLPNRSLTENEKHVFDILDHIGGEGWRNSSESLSGLHAWYSRELSKVCDEKNINYFDSNSLLNKDYNEDIFVDRVHLTDYSNKIVSDFIVEKIWN
jgi:hypothetical protein